MSKQEIDKTYFITFCIEQFKEHRGISGAEAAELLFASSITDYLSDNFEVLHTQSRQWLMEEIEERLKTADAMSKIKIYHGSLNQVAAPEIRLPNRTLDYGCGFYTTTSYQQAEDWVTRHAKDRPKPDHGFVNVYEVDIENVKANNCLWFDEPTEEWVDFVYANRNIRGFTHNYDFVYGPVANDRVYAAFALYEAGLLNKQELIRELKIYELVDQLLMHTTRSLKKITFLESKEIRL